MGIKYCVPIIPAEIDPLAALARKLKKNAKKYPVSKAKGRHTKYTGLGK